MKKETFDNIIKNNLLQDRLSPSDFGYELTGKEPYLNYYENNKMEKFINDMKTYYPNAYNKYYHGAGNELIEIKGKWGITPPKMASIASSSRFTYIALRDGTDALIPDYNIGKDEIIFEKECRIFNRGSAPQLDAYIEHNDCHYYIEAKCHEIFDPHKIQLKNKYYHIFNNDFKSLLKDVVKGKDTFILPKENFGLTGKHLRFDVKQFMCHLLGIKNASNNKNSKLIYLFFKPMCDDTQIQDEINKVFDKLKEEIITLFNHPAIKDYCKANHIELQAIAQYSKVMTKLDHNNIEILYKPTGE